MILGQYLPIIKTPADLVIIGRASISEASFQDIKIAVEKLLLKAGLLDQNDCV